MKRHNRNTRYVTIENNCIYNKYYNKYDDDYFLNSYKHFHYWNKPIFGVENYPFTVSQIAINESNPNMRNRALDIGCSVGRISFELTKQFNHVIGIDSSSKSIDVAHEMKENKLVKWQITEQGDINKYYNISANELNLNNENLEKAIFIETDIDNIMFSNDKEYNGFDLVIASNLIDRLKQPKLFLDLIYQKTNINGIFILLDPYDWNQSYTPKLNWIGAILNDTNSDAIYSQNVIRNTLLSKNKYNDRINWQFVKEFEIQWILIKNSRTYTHGISHCLIFQRI